MLVAIVSGVITHRRIFADFFTFRRNKGQRSWLDAHNATAVLALPFHLMITYTGLITLMFMIMPGRAKRLSRPGRREGLLRGSVSGRRRTRQGGGRGGAADRAAGPGRTRQHGKAHRWRWWWSTTRGCQGDSGRHAPETGHTFVTATGAALRGRQRTSGGGAR
jgi:hypothetical protein